MVDWVLVIFSALVASIDLAATLRDTTTSPERIDLHHHFLSPTYAAYLRSHGERKLQALQNQTMQLSLNQSACAGPFLFTMVFESKPCAYRYSRLKTNVPAGCFSQHKASFTGGNRTDLPQNWTAESSLAFMDASGISTAILSITVPGLDFGDLQEAARQAREVPLPHYASLSIAESTTEPETCQ